MKILIADDDPTTRHLLRATLGQWGYDVAEAANGEDAWARFATDPEVRLGIVDWMMPGLSGPELCRRLKGSDLKPAPYVILLTSRTEWRDLVSGLEAGADDYIAKPYHLGELRARLDVGRRLVGLQQTLIENNEHLEARVRERTDEIQKLLRLNQELIVQLGHDLRTSLTPLVALLPVLWSDETDPERKDSLRLCLGPVRHLRRLAERVFEFGRIDTTGSSAVWRAVGLRAVAETAIDGLLQDERGEASRVTLDIPGGLCVLGEAPRLQRVFEDILDNAFRFSPPGTPITVTSEIRGAEVLVSVIDRGEGLAPHQLERVFDPFYTGDEARHDRRANGLGLTICRRVIERHGGRIWAESDGAGGGTRIRFTLTLASEAMPATFPSVPPRHVLP